MVATTAASFLTFSVAAIVLSNLAFLCLYAAIGIAVLKYRLYEIDVVISKAVLYGSLAVFITAVYVGLVAGVGTLVGNRRNALLSALAAAVVAVAFQPVRQWARRLANRVVYGRRASPYQVLSEFAQRIGGAYSSEDVLPQMAHIVAAGTGAERVVVWLRVDDEFRPGACSDERPHPAGLAVDGLPADVLPFDGQAMPPVPDADLSVPVVHQGDLLGAISVRMPKAEPLGPAGEQLVADVASQAGLVLSNAGLIEDLRASRQRLVTAQDDARRRLERNIHDGAQQDLVALAIKLRIAAMTLDDDPAQQILGELQADAAGALENLRDLARGIYPPLLADLGLAAALSAQASKSPVPVTVEADGIGRFPQDTEAAVYFCCLEALQNIAKYAHATQPGSAFGPRTGRCPSPCPTTEPATTPGIPPWAPASGTWPTGSPRSAATWKSGPPPARAPPSPRTSPSPSRAAAIAHPLSAAGPRCAAAFSGPTGLPAPSVPASVAANDQFRSLRRMRARWARSVWLSRPKARSASVPRAARIASRTLAPCSVTSTRVARRSPGSDRRRTRPRDSRASTTSVVERAAMCRWSDSSDRRIDPWRLSTRRARRCEGVISQGARAS